MPGCFHGLLPERLLTDNNVDDLLTETVNVSGTVALSDMHTSTPAACILSAGR
jgi:hypothetical protein